ncbi:hypothetical protein TNCV_4159791 [Trichonephila clavipes]|nr:hypothetical protein TNCV_4159791 [Trichonephila clavipes]
MSFNVGTIGYDIEDSLAKADCLDISRPDTFSIFSEIFFDSKKKLRDLWRVPPELVWYPRKCPVGAVLFENYRCQQTLSLSCISRFASGHLKSLSDKRRIKRELQGAPEEEIQRIEDRGRQATGLPYPIHLQRYEACSWLLTEFGKCSGALSCMNHVFWCVVAGTSSRNFGKTLALSTMQMTVPFCSVPPQNLEGNNLGGVQGPPASFHQPYERTCGSAAI